MNLAAAIRDRSSGTSEIDINGETKLRVLADVWFDQAAAASRPGAAREVVMPSVKERLREGPPLSGYLNLIRCPWPRRPWPPRARTYR